jgi:acyl transferase domain-containing protein
MRAFLSWCGFLGALSLATPVLGGAKGCGSLLGDYQPVGVHPFYSLPLASEAAQAMKQHVFRGQAVMPGAAFLSNALKAASLLDPDLPYVTLESFTISEPLLLSEAMGASCLLTQISSVQRRSASVSCGSRDSSNNLTVHAVGGVKLGKAWPKPATQPYSLISRDAVKIKTRSLYESFDLIGLVYGPLFQRVSALSVSGFWTNALIEPVPEGGGLLHPAALDSVLQTIAAPLIADSLHQGFTGASPPAAVPLFFGRVTWNSAAAPETLYRVRTHLSAEELPTRSDKKIEYRILVTDRFGHPVLGIEGGRLGILEADFNF